MRGARRGGGARGAADRAAHRAHLRKVGHGAPPRAGRPAVLWPCYLAIPSLLFGEYLPHTYHRYWRGPCAGGRGPNPNPDPNPNPNPNPSQADEDRAGLTLELSTLRERLAETEERLATLAVEGNGLPPPPSAPAPVPAPAPAPATGEISRGLSFKAPKLGKLSKPTLDFKRPGRK